MNKQMASALATVDLETAYRESYYTIIGAGGDLAEWIQGYDGMLAEQGIGHPKAFYTATGRDVNEKFGPGADPFEDELIFLFFPLEGLDISKLAIFRLRMGDKWFDDLINNRRVSDYGDD